RARGCCRRSICRWSRDEACGGGRRPPPRHPSPRYGVTVTVIWRWLFRRDREPGEVSRGADEAGWMQRDAGVALRVTGSGGRDPDGPAVREGLDVEGRDGRGA